MSDFFFHDRIRSLIIFGALTGGTEIPSVFIGLLCSLNDNAARLQEGHSAETRATATCLTGRFLCLWRRLWTFVGRVSCKMSSDGTSSYLSNEQHKPSCVEVFPLRDWIAAVSPVQVLIAWMLRWDHDRPVLNFHPSRDG